MNHDKELMARIEMSMLSALVIIEKAFGVSIPKPNIVFRQLGRRLGCCRVFWKTDLTALTPSQYLYINPKRRRKFIHKVDKTKSPVMTLNSDMFRDNLEQMINETIPHEIAHAGAMWIYEWSGRGHGTHWKQIMRLLGLSPERLAHDIDMTNVKVKKKTRPFAYKCSCPDHVIFLTATIHRRIQAGRKYTCPRCHSALIFYGVKQAA